MSPRKKGGLVDARQLRAARAVLGWTIDETAANAGIHRSSVLRLEKQKALPYVAYAADRVGAAMESEGIRFASDEAGPSVAFDGLRKRTGARYVRRVTKGA